MLKDEILGDQVPRHRRNWFALIYRSSLICALLLVSLQIFVPSTSFAHSNTYKDNPPSGWNDKGTVTIRSIGSGDYVSANGNLPDWPLEASKSKDEISQAPNSWEKFEEWQFLGTGQYAFQSKGSGDYVSANGNVLPIWPLEASSPEINGNLNDSWEVFDLAPDRLSQTPIYSVGDDRFVTANGNASLWPLDADIANPQGWEEFDIEPA